MTVAEWTPERSARAMLEHWEVVHGKKHRILAGIVQIDLTAAVRQRMVEDLTALLNDAIRRTRGDYST